MIAASVILTLFAGMAAGRMDGAVCARPDRYVDRLGDLPEHFKALLDLHIDRPA